jgi:hypothetical protein
VLGSARSRLFIQDISENKAVATSTLAKACETLRGGKNLGRARNRKTVLINRLWKARRRTMPGWGEYRVGLAISEIDRLLSGYY